MRFILLLIIAFSTACLSATAQSDFGWFTGRLSAFYISGSSHAGISYAHLYNLDNIHSLGMDIGITMASEAPQIPLQAAYALHPLGRKPLMPLFSLSGGFAIGNSRKPGSPVMQASVGIETGNIRRLRCALQCGYMRIAHANAITAGANLLF